MRTLRSWTFVVLAVFAVTPGAALAGTVQGAPGGGAGSGAGAASPTAAAPPAPAPAAPASSASSGPSGSGTAVPVGSASGGFVPRDADDELYLQRFRALAANPRGLEGYDPLEAVPGAKRYRPLAAVRDGRGTIAAGALEAARAYAERNNSNALVVWRDGRIEGQYYFQGNDASTPIVSRSLAKPLTAIAIGRAIELGKIRSLDQPVADFVAEWRDDPRRSKILVRHLLDMRSGFLPQAVATKPEDILNLAYLHPRHDEIIVRDYPVVDEPGTRYEYNNATSEMVAVVIERATGRRYAEFVSTEVLQPLGAAGGQVWINRPGGMAHSGCCIMLPPETWLRLGVLLLDDGVWNGRRLLPAGYVAEMRRGTAQYPYYGLGVYVAGRYTERRGFANPERQPVAQRVLHSEPYLAGDLFLFDGNANQVVYVVPSERLVIVRTGNAPPRRDGVEWDNAFLPNTILRGIERRPGERVPEPQPR
jgi:CubicO group peptidase (beta-lactamase class C family)